MKVLEITRSRDGRDDHVRQFQLRWARISSWGGFAKGRRRSKISFQEPVSRLDFYRSAPKIISDTVRDRGRSSSIRKIRCH